MAVATVDTRVEHVTVYASGARVRRTATIPAPLPSRVRIAGLPLSVIEDTVRVEVGGPAVATMVRTGLDVPSEDAVTSEEPADLREARRQVARAEAEIERLSRALELLASAHPVEPAPDDEPAPSWSAVVAARTGMIRLRAERELALREQLAAARRVLDDATKALSALVDREQRASSARPPTLHAVRRFVEIELQASAASEIVLHVEYLVAAARWVPTYVARLDGEQVGFEVRALVAQATGEDWVGVPLALSTAEPDRFATLPELAMQKIGRATQHEPVRAGFRAPPAGAKALYLDYEQVFDAAREERAARRVSARPRGALLAEPLPSPSPASLPPFAPPPPPMPPPMPMPGGAPMPVPIGAPKPAPPAPMVERMREVAHADQERDEAPARSAPVARPIMHSSLARTLLGGGPGELEAPPPSVPRLDYDRLRMAPPSSSLRGQLIPAPVSELASEIAREVESARARVASMPVPPGCRAEWSHTYDYAFVTDGAVDVRANGTWLSIPVTTASGHASVRHVAVPREQADVFRVATITNPLASPLLPGPLDVYDRGQFLVTSSVDFTPPGGTVEVGLGVDAAIKIARNTEFREEASGMLRGALRLVHAITIDVENLSARAIDLEVRERIPVTRQGEDEIEISVGRVEPAWERWAPEPDAPHATRLRGGYRWKLQLPAGVKRTLRAGYEIKIASKHELVGGNRREA